MVSSFELFISKNIEQILNEIRLKNVPFWFPGVVQPTTSRQTLTELDTGSRLGVTHARRFADSGQYQCKAQNEAGSVTAVAHLSIQTRGELAWHIWTFNGESGSFAFRFMLKHERESEECQRG